jgi:predicted ATPase
MMRHPRLSENGDRLLSDGANVASVLHSLGLYEPDTLDKITEYLAHITPGVEKIEGVNYGGYRLVEIEQQIKNDRGIWRVRPHQLSDGTLRALGVLVALFQSQVGGTSELSLVAIEEPESGLHPAAAVVLLDALRDASSTTQVLVTTHSADMLHMGAVDIDSLLSVEGGDDGTIIGPIDDVSKSIVRDRLFTVGDLLQMDQLRPGADDDTGGAEETRQSAAGRT